MFNWNCDNHLAGGIRIIGGGIRDFFGIGEDFCNWGSSFKGKRFKFLVGKEGFD